MFSPRPRQRACQDPLTRQGGDALMWAGLRCMHLVNFDLLNITHVATKVHMILGGLQC